jgi:predicted esterase
MSEVENKMKNSGSRILNVLLWILLIVLLFIPGYFFYISFITNTEQEEQENPSDETVRDSTDISGDSFTPVEEDTENIYTEDPVQGENFFEKFPVVNSQQSYVAIPMRVDTENPPSIVIYNHGDYEIVSNSVSGDFMEKLREYSISFTSENFIFSASAIHDNANTDNNSVEDIHLLIGWIQENYTASPDIYLIGFSRGGYTTTNYILEYPDDVKAIALLAPATYYTEWNQTKVNIIKDISIQIWHGTSDTNIAVIHSENFVNRLAQYDKEVTLNKEDGKTHYDVDDEYIDEIIDFFESTVQ